MALVTAKDYNIVMCHVFIIKRDCNEKLFYLNSLLDYFR